MRAFSYDTDRGRQRGFHDTESWVSLVYGGSNAVGVYVKRDMLSLKGKRRRDKTD